MLLVHSQHASGGAAVGGVEHYACAVAGLGATLGAGFVLFGSLVVLVESAGVLGTTILVALLFFWWAVWWQAFELAWDRLGRRRVHDGS